MRKEPTDGTYRRESSLYLKKDYRSRLFSGRWEKQWLQEVSDWAMKNNTSIYEAMWKNSHNKTEHIPEHLFKFFPFNHNSIKCLERNAVFMNNPQNFNDPFDCVLCANEKEFVKKNLVEHLNKTNAIGRGVLNKDEFDQLENSDCTEYKNYDYIYGKFDSVVSHLCYDADLNILKKGNDEIRGVMYESRKRYMDALEKLRESTVRISSFANINEFKMLTFMELWAHYAQNHEGFCVEYDLSKPLDEIKNNEMLLGGLLPCDYSTKQILLSKRKIYKYTENIPFTVCEKIEFNKSIMLSFLKKSSSWRYENEWRLVLPKDVCDIYDNMIPFFPIKSIYLGCKMAIDNREFLYLLSKRKGINIYNMNMHEYRFELQGDYFAIDVDKYFDNKNVDRLKRLHKAEYMFWNN